MKGALPRSSSRAALCSHSLAAKQLVGLQLRLLAGLPPAPPPEPPQPLLRAHGQQQDQVWLQQVAWPAVNLRPPGWQIAHLAADGRADAIGRRAVPVPETSGIWIQQASVHVINTAINKD